MRKGGEKMKKLKDYYAHLASILFNKSEKEITKAEREGVKIKALNFTYKK